MLPYTRTCLWRQELSCYRRQQILLQESNVCFQPGIQSHPSAETAGSRLEEINDGGTLSRERQLRVLHHHAATSVVPSEELEANYGTCNRKTADPDTHSLQTTNAYRLCWQWRREDNPGALCLSTEKWGSCTCCSWDATAQPTGCRPQSKSQASTQEPKNQREEYSVIMT